MSDIKAFARMLYGSVPGLAAARFTVKDYLGALCPKPEFAGVARLGIGQGVVVDVGANRGQSIAAFRRFAPDAVIVAFEPGPAGDNLAKRYVYQPLVRIRRCALGSTDGNMSLYVPTYGRWECDGMAATSYEQATAWLRDPGQMFRFNPRKLCVHQRDVAVTTLDNFKLAPDLIKLHAQGAEFDILCGAAKTIRQHNPAIMCAFPTMEVTGLLREMGYHPYVYRGNRFKSGFEHRGTFTWFLQPSTKRREHASTDRHL